MPTDEINNDVGAPVSTEDQEQATVAPVQMTREDFKAMLYNHFTDDEKANISDLVAQITVKGADAAQEVNTGMKLAMMFLTSYPRGPEVGKYVAMAVGLAVEDWLKDQSAPAAPEAVVHG